MKKYTVHTEFKSMCMVTIIISVLVLCISLLVFYFLPDSSSTSSPIIATSDDTPAEQENVVEVSFSNLSVEEKTVNKIEDDKGLLFYRNPVSRSSVEWFYMHITNDRDITLAILKEADRNDIPLALAFSLAHTESRYKKTAVNVNTNKSIDRGIFQLNNCSFPSLAVKDFFDPYVNAHYGLSHLRFCLKTAGNEVTALAMYNAGTNKVQKNGTPQRTLNYVNAIMAYQESLEDLFNSEVVSFYDDSVDSDNVVILAKK